MVDHPTRDELTPEEIQELEDAVKGDGPIVKVDEAKVQQLVQAAEDAKKDTDPDAWQTIRTEIEDVKAQVHLAMQHEPPPEPTPQLVGGGESGAVMVGKIDSETGSGVYVVTQQTGSSGSWAAVASTHRYYQISMRDINGTTGIALTTVVTFWEQLDSDGTVELVGEVLKLPASPTIGDILYGTSGKLEWLSIGNVNNVLTAGSVPQWVAPVAKVKVDSGATAGFIGENFDNGVVRTGTGLTWTDGGDSITIALDSNHVNCLISGHEAGRTVAVDPGATPGYLGIAVGDGVLRFTADFAVTDGGNFITIGLA